MLTSYTGILHLSKIWLELNNGQLSDTRNLLDALNDEIEMEKVEEEEEDLMLALSLDAEQIIAPKPDAGGDQSLKAYDDGTAVILLDGSGTRDPQDRIVSWSWVDDTGRKLQTRARSGSN